MLYEDEAFVIMLIGAIPNGKRFTFRQKSDSEASTSKEDDSLKIIHIQRKGNFDVLRDAEYH